MPTRKNISLSDDEDGNEEGDSEPTLPPSKKAKTTTSNKNSATSASDTRLRTVTSKQAALSDFFFPPFGILETN